MSKLNLDEAAKKYVASIIYEYGCYDGDFLIPICEDIFKAGAEWQAEQDQETIELAEDNAYLAGAVNERKKMMKEAVEGTVYGNGDYTWVAGDIPSQFKYGDKVRFIIINEDKS